MPTTGRQSTDSDQGLASSSFFILGGGKGHFPMVKTSSTVKPYRDENKTHWGDCAHAGLVYLPDMGGGDETGVDGFEP